MSIIKLLFHYILTSRSKNIYFNINVLDQSKILHMKHYNYKIKSLHHFIYNTNIIVCYHQNQYVTHRVNTHTHTHTHVCICICICILLGDYCIFLVLLYICILVDNIVFLGR